MYIVTRGDMSPGYQAVQSIHAMRQYVEEHPIDEQEWFENSNYLALLSVEDEQKLVELIEKALRKGIRLSVFREPDIGNEVTAIAMEPKAKRLCNKLKLALSSP